MNLCAIRTAKLQQLDGPTKGQIGITIYWQVKIFLWIILELLIIMCKLIIMEAAIRIQGKCSDSRSTKIVRRVMDLRSIRIRICLRKCLESTRFDIKKEVSTIINQQLWLIIMILWARHLTFLIRKIMELWQRMRSTDLDWNQEIWPPISTRASKD